MFVPDHAKPRGQKRRGMGALAPEPQERLPPVAKVVVVGVANEHSTAYVDDAEHADAVEHFHDQFCASPHELFFRPLSPSPAQTLQAETPIFLGLDRHEQRQVLHVLAHMPLFSFHFESFGQLSLLSSQQSTKF